MTKSYVWLENAWLLANKGLVLKIINNTTEIRPQTPKPAKSAQTESSIKLPTKIEIGIDKMVEIKPVMAAPIPAIWPIGSIAIDRIFPQINPKHKNCSERNSNKIVILGSLELRNNKL